MENRCVQIIWSSNKWQSNCVKSGPHVLWENTHGKCLAKKPYVQTAEKTMNALVKKFENNRETRK
jgi:hypothetical protein